MNQAHLLEVLSHLECFNLQHQILARALLLLRETYSLAAHQQWCHRASQQALHNQLLPCSTAFNHQIQPRDWVHFLLVIWIRHNQLLLVVLVAYQFQFLGRAPWGNPLRKYNGYHRVKYGKLLVWVVKARISRSSETWSRPFTQGVVDSCNLQPSV